MSDTRERILAAVRRARSDASVETTRAPRLRWEEPEVERFSVQLALAAATRERVATREDLAAAVARYVHAQSLMTPVRLDVANHAELPHDGFPDDWDVQRGGTPRPRTRFGLSQAFAGIAETGTLMLYSGTDSPVTLNFLPEHHLVAVAAEKIVAHFEDAWALARRRADFPPRAVNLITGPSRTADIERTLQLGAHGPRRLHVLIVGDQSPD